MIGDVIVHGFTWVCWMGAVAAIGAYVWSFLKHRPYSRLWNSAGLLFTGLALTQVPLFLREGVTGPGGGALYAGFAVAFLSAAVALQSVTALRRRRRADAA